MLTTSGVLVSLITGLISLFTAEKPKRSRKFFLAFLYPFIFVYTFYFTWIFSSMILSEWKKVDIGIGDYWYAPINKEYKIAFIDLSEYAYIESSFKNIHNIKALNTIKNNLIIRKKDNSIIRINLNNNNRSFYTNLNKI